MVTAQHVVQQHNETIAAIRDKGDQVVSWRVEGPWFFPEDPFVDLAMTRVPAIGPRKGLRSLIPMTDTVEQYGIGPQYGERVLFVGMLESIKSTIEDVRPVVRHGTLAAKFQRGVTWGTQTEPNKWTAEAVHLIDCRSWAGFSGSPCFMNSSYPGPRDDPVTPFDSLLTECIGSLKVPALPVDF